GQAENDEFVELYNPTSSPVDLTGWSVLTQNATGGNPDTVQLGGVLLAHRFLLIGDAEMISVPDYPLANFSLTNSGGSIILRDASQQTIDALGWGSPLVKEGNPCGSSLPDASSLERKASASSTAQTLGPGGSEELNGNGCDTDNNANDFVIQTAVSPQNSASPAEPLEQGAGFGTASLSPLAAPGSVPTTFHIVFRSDTTTASQVWIVVPSVFEWPQTADSVNLVPLASASVAVSGDTVKVGGLNTSSPDSVVVEILSVIPPDSTDQFTFAVLSASGTKLPSSLKVNPSTLIHGTPRTIASVKRNNSSGVPLLLDRWVTIRGTVTVATQFGGPAYIQDTTAGMAVYDSTFEQACTIGDDVTITGKISQYNGLTELKNAVALAFNGGGNDVTPLRLRLSDIANDGAGGVERYEGMLVRVDSVTVNTSSWAVSGSGSNYVLYDGRGDSIQIRIMADIDIANTSAPQGEFSVVGVVGQFQRNPPFIGGYQLMPRSLLDIIAETAGPGIRLDPPYEVSLDSTSITLSWKTLEPGTTSIRYGLTTEYELGERTNTSVDSLHRMTLTNLQPATPYHVLISSSNARGTSALADYVTSTASSGSTGRFEVYFNQSVDTTLARGETAQGGPAFFMPKLLDRISAAQSSIDVCLYSLSGYPGDQIAQALLAARSRGVHVRVIAERDNMGLSSGFEALQNGGIRVIGDDFDARNAGAGYMHNKFFIFDNNNPSSPANDWVLTGSWNPTNPGTYQDYQNVILVQDRALAVAYTLEFNEMWGSSTDVPDAQQSRFGVDKLDDTPHVFLINGTRVELYFSPSDHTAPHIVRRINAAENAIDMGLLTLTRRDVALTLVSRIRSGVRVRGVIDNRTDAGSQFDYLLGSGADLLLDQSQVVLLHHKYAIFDGERFPSDAWVETGSYNWTSAAENSNNENALFIQSGRIANLYLQEFSKRYAENGGRDTIRITRVAERSIPKTLSLRQNYPNPFNPATTITYALPVDAKVRLTVYDNLGRIVRILVDGSAAAGTYTVSFDAQALPSGVYFYRLESQLGSAAKAMLLVR
ncbi:MAG: hypothetical protein COS95_00575, partial [Ignavibacteriales bacterium CG07_land_8_20_14_0_80_59_12]